MLTKNENHIQRALDNRIEQFKNSSNLADLITIYVEQVQDHENAVFQILDDTNLDSASGENLDNIGAIVGEDRFGRTDTQYRYAIRARIKLNLSNGTHENVVQLIQSIAGESVSVKIVEYYPASFDAIINDPIDPLLVDTERISFYVSSGRPSGVMGFIVFFVQDPFQYDTGLGYDDGKYGNAIKS